MKEWKARLLCARAQLKCSLIFTRITIRLIWIIIIILPLVIKVFSELFHTTQLKHLTLEFCEKYLEIDVLLSCRFFSLSKIGAIFCGRSGSGRIWWLAYFNWHFLGQISHYVSVFISISNITVFLWGFPCGLRLLPVKGFCSTIPEVYQINAACGGWLNGKTNAKWFHAKNNLHSPVCTTAHIFASLNQSDGHFLFAFVPKG